MPVSCSKRQLCVVVSGERETLQVLLIDDVCPLTHSKQINIYAFIKGVKMPGDKTAPGTLVNVVTGVRAIPPGTKGLRSC